MEDTILGKIQFQVSATQTASAPGASAYALELTQMRGRRGGMGMRGGGRRGGGRPGMMRGGRLGSGARAPGAAPGRPAGVQAGTNIPPRLNYGFRLTMDLEE